MRALVIIAAFFCITMTSATASASDALDQCANTCNWAAQDTGNQALKDPCILGGCKNMDAKPDVSTCKARCTFTYNNTNKDYTGHTDYYWCSYGCEAYPAN